MSKRLKTIRCAIETCDLKSGMTISFHHHLRNGDYVLSMVLDEIARLGLRDIKLAISAIFDCHACILEYAKNGVISTIDTNYVSACVGEGISNGVFDRHITFRTHGGRPTAIQSGDLKIDVAFIAAPCSDPYGNLNGIHGPSACGSLGYAFSDAQYANKVVAITDHLVEYPAHPISIPESHVDYVVVVDRIGDPTGIASGTTQITANPVSLHIAKTTAEIIESSGLFKQGFSYQTGAGGISLAVTRFLKDKMQQRGISGGFALGGITGHLVELLEEGFFQTLLDVQCFDLQAVESIRRNPDHVEISAMHYAAPLSRSAAVDHLDFVILGATEIDLQFNVNVHTDSNGIIIGGSGGHSDTAAGAKISIVVAPLVRARLPIVVDRVLCVSTPGDTIDILVTQHGVAVNPRRRSLKKRLESNGIRVVDIHYLKEYAEQLTGVPCKPAFDQQIVADVVNRDGRVLDHIYKICNHPIFKQS